MNETVQTTAEAPSDVPASGVSAVGMTGITKRFGDVTAVDDLHLEVGDGEFFALLGPSGCGKTTTLRMIAGLEFPTMGSLRVFGDEVGTLPANKRPVNTVFQNYALFPHLNIEDNVAFGLKMQKVDRSERNRRVGEALELVQLGHLSARRPEQLSGGQQQRIALARALVNRPKVLLLDEPLGALDLKLRQQMQGELKGLQRELGITFVFVTHDQEEALTMSDRIGVMRDGELLQVDPPEAIYERPVNRFVADFIGQTNLLEGTVEDRSTVCLRNGARIPIESDHPAGTSVAVILRPERAGLAEIGTASGSASLEGTVSSVTYLGNAVVYGVDLDWMHVEVRAENRPDARRFEAGEAVAMSWTPDAVALVAD